VPTTSSTTTVLASSTHYVVDVHQHQLHHEHEHVDVEQQLHLDEHQHELDGRAHHPPAAGAAAGAADGPTFLSVGCRLDDLLADVRGATALGTSAPSPPRTRTRPSDRLADALTACESGDTKHAKTRLAQVKKALVQYAHRLRGRAARRRLDPAVREGFLAAGDTIDPTSARYGRRSPAPPTPRRRR
jgi:hypothetical protein